MDLAVFPENVVNPLAWVQQIADCGLVIQTVDEQCDVLAHVGTDVIRAGEQFR